MLIMTCILAVFFVLTKDFDTVDHNILLDKMNQFFEIRGLAL